MAIKFVFSLLAAISLYSAPAAEWPGLPQGIWGKTPKDFKSDPSAVIILDSTRFRDKELARFKRVLILGDAGRGAAEIVGINPNAIDLEGRVLYPDGLIIPFQNGKDILLQTNVTYKNKSSKTYRIMPPGVNSHCLIDFRWKEPIGENWRSIPEYYGLSLDLRIPSEYFLERSEIIIEHQVERSNWSYKFEVNPDCQPKVINSELETKYIFSDVPALRKIPFSSNADTGRPRFFFYYEFDIAHALLDFYGDTAKYNLTYWQAISQTMVWQRFERDVSIGSIFKNWVEVNSKDLPLDPNEKANELLRRMHAAVKPAHELTDQERPYLEGKTKQRDTVRLDELITSGIADAHSIQLLYYHLLRRTGLDPMIVFSVDRDENRLRIAQNNVFQFDCTLIGIMLPNKQMACFDPASRWTGGKVLPWFQGSNAILFVPGNTRKDWDVKMGTLPVLLENSNRKMWNFHIEFAGNDELISLEGRAIGVPAWQLRRELAFQDLNNQRRSMQTALETAFNAALWKNVEIINAQDPDKDISWKASGIKEIEYERSFKIYPFPGIQSPISIPESWPLDRTQPIIMPFLGQLEAECHITIPPGYKTPAAFTFRKNNVIGDVEWIVTPLKFGVINSGTSIKMTIVTKSHKANIDRYEDLKEWAGWIKEVMGMYLILDKN